MTVSLQRCAACGTYQYPSRDLCRSCLADALQWVEQTYSGTVLAEARICRSLEPERLAQGPLRIGSVALDVGVRVIAMLDNGVGAGARVRLHHAGGENARVLCARIASET